MWGRWGVYGIRCYDINMEENGHFLCPVTTQQRFIKKITPTNCVYVNRRLKFVWNYVRISSVLFFYAFVFWNSNNGPPYPVKAIVSSGILRILCSFGRPSLHNSLKTLPIFVYLPFEVCLFISLYLFSQCLLTFALLTTTMYSNIIPNISLVGEGISVC